MKLGRFADQDPVAESEATARVEEERLATEAIAVGSRCEITGAGGMPKRGVVMFTGEKRIPYNGNILLGFIFVIFLTESPNTKI